MAWSPPAQPLAAATAAAAIAAAATATARTAAAARAVSAAHLVSSRGSAAAAPRNSFCLCIPRPPPGSRITEGRIDEEADLYDLLHITRSATEDEVTASYRRLARLFHPDKASEGGPEGPPSSARGRGFQGNPSHFSEGGPTPFVRLNNAYSILKNKALREVYDVEGLEGISVAEKLLREEQAKALQLAVPSSLESLQDRVAAVLRQQQQQRRLLRVTAAVELPFSISFFDSMYRRRLFAALNRHSSSSSSSGEDEDYDVEGMELNDYEETLPQEEGPAVQLADAALSHSLEASPWPGFDTSLVLGTQVLRSGAAAVAAAVAARVALCC
ncbi:hypothetical protein Esti_000215 [Eimeria stiedai]